MCKNITFFSLFCYITFSFNVLQAQKVRIETSSPIIALNEPFTISIESEGAEIKNTPFFPEIAGFKKIKNGLSDATSQVTRDGKITTTYILTQTYHPLREGTFILRPFKVLVNQTEAESAGATIKVKAFDKNKGELIEFDTEELLKTEAEQFIEVQDDAFLGLSVNKEIVFVGEGVAVTLAFYVAQTNQAPMRFYELDRQVEAIARQLKPNNCWEENFNILEIPEPPKLTINGKVYEQSKFYEAVFFPFNDKPIILPQVSLQIQVKEKIGKGENPNDFSDFSKLIIKTFVSQAKTITVKPLPPHPLRDKVTVGIFYLQEIYPTQLLKTGENFNYAFRIAGEGNIAAINQPVILPMAQLEIYPPNRQQFVSRGQSKITGAMAFDYPMLGKEAGSYALSERFEWIFFNPGTARYDTLHPTAVVRVSGERVQNSEIAEFANHPFYHRVSRADSKWRKVNKNQSVRIVFNIFMILILLTTVGLMWRK